MKLYEIINKLEESFPINLEEKWDNSGLLIGDRNSEISAIQISLDITDSVIDKAIENGCELIITHHPIIFESIKKINDSTILGKKILKLIKNGINVYSAHTNLDSAKDGLNNYIAQKLLAKDAKIMDENFYSVYKMNIFVSKSILAEVLSILNGSRELEFLEYKRVTYTSKVTERVLVNNEIKELDSYNIQIMGEKNKLYSILNKIREKHSISEIAFEILPLENKHKTGTGLGRFFKLENPMSLEEYISFVKDKLNLDFVKVVKANDKLIKKVAIVNGSGAEFWKKAYDMRADVFITGDFKYHNALDAYEKGLNIVDIGHYEAEHFFYEIIIKKLDDNLRVEVYNEKRILEIK